MPTINVAPDPASRKLAPPKAAASVFGFTLCGAGGGGGGRTKWKESTTKTRVKKGRAPLNRSIAQSCKIFEP
jgi:hypothetical protein